MPTLQDYKEARRLAVSALKGRDWKACCRKAGVDIQKVSGNRQQVSIPYLGRDHPLLVSDETIVFEKTDPPLSIPDQVLLLHYLLEASGTPLENRWITFREVPSGPFYYPSFVKRAVEPLVKAVGQNPEVLKRAALHLGQPVTAPGDVALRVAALPRIPIGSSSTGPHAAPTAALCCRPTCRPRRSARTSTSSCRPCGRSWSSPAAWP